MSWDEVLQKIDESEAGIDLSALSTGEIEGLFEHLSDDEVDRIASDLEAAKNSARDRREFVARALDALSTLGGISLRLLRG